MKIDEMTERQQRAITSDAKQILCVAGPGSGKTTTLAHRIRRILSEGKCHPKAITAITYTNAAARNLEERINSGQLWSAAGGVQLGYCGTLHGYCLRMLKRHGQLFGYGDRTGIIDEDAARSLIETHAKQLSAKDPIDKILKLKALGRPKGPNFTASELVVLAYMEELAASGLLDYDLILTEFHRLLVTQPGIQRAIEAETEHLFVDEVQDSSLIDWKIFTELPIANKFLVGDPDQAIFGFRGGDPSLMVKTSFNTRCEVLYLEENFRCKPAICMAANRLIRHNTNRIEKETTSATPPNRDSGRVVAFGQTQNEGDEIAQVLGFARSSSLNVDEFAIIARTNAIANGFREALKAGGIQVTEPPKSNLPPDWPMVRAIIEMMAQPTNDTLAYFYCVAAAQHKGANAFKARAVADDIRRAAMARGERINHGWAGAQPTIMEVPQALDRDKVSLESRMQVGEILRLLPPGSTITDLALEVATLERPIEPDKMTGVDVMTIHAAKGREWDIVFLVGFEDQVTPGSAASADVEEERRLAFVALTRARNAVYISHAAARRANWGTKPFQPHKVSRFLKEIIT